VSVYRKGRFRVGYARERYDMPVNFCMDDNYEEVAGFLIGLRHRMLEGLRRMRLARVRGGPKASSPGSTNIEGYADFAMVKRITPAAALILASEYDRLRTILRRPEWLSAVNIERWDEDVLATLDDLGFLALLGVDDPARELPRREGRYIVPFLTGDGVTPTEIDRLLRALADLAVVESREDGDNLLRRARIYDGLGEAIQNVVDHAYPDSFPFEFPAVNRWWMAGAVDPNNGRFTVVIYDQGISIPVSVPRWSRIDEFKARFAAAVGREFDMSAPIYDGQAIAEAMAMGKSSTGRSERGNGLPCIRDVIDNCRDGRLRIVSRNGEYRYALNQKPEHRTLVTPLPGTLIEWDMWI
jgi:hypothetical protein